MPQWESIVHLPGFHVEKMEGLFKKIHAAESENGHNIKNDNN